MKTANGMMVALLAGSVVARGDTLRIDSLEKTGRLTFNEVTNALAYRVEWASDLNSVAWSSNAPGISGVPPSGSGMIVVTVGLAYAQCFYRVVASLTNGATPPPGMVLIPAGSFMMGNATNVFSEGESAELPRHEVTVSAFYLGVREVTKTQWDEVATWAATNGYDIAPGDGAGKATNHPVHYVSWYECAKWCNAKSEKDRLTACYTVNGEVYRTNNLAPDCNWTAPGYRLPTEAEWEKAARGGAADHRFPWTDTNTIQHARANYMASGGESYDLSNGEGFHDTYETNGVPYTSPAGSFPPNGYGLCDMAGDVKEWCWDLFDATYYAWSAPTNPRGPFSGSTRVLRGGAWNTYARDCRVAARYHYNPIFEINDIGFRIARTAP
jgi:formylglycine-generating enzyme required for sulfatase activity